MHFMDVAKAMKVTHVTCYPLFVLQHRVRKLSHQCPRGAGTAEGRERLLDQETLERELTTPPGQGRHSTERRGGTCVILFYVVPPRTQPSTKRLTSWGSTSASLSPPSCCFPSDGPSFQSELQKDSPFAIFGLEPSLCTFQVLLLLPFNS